MADTAQTVAARCLEPGETTSEHALTTSARLHGYLVMVAGLIGPQLLTMISALPFFQTPAGQLTATIIGGVLAYAGYTQAGNAVTAQIAGRNLIKAAAVKDVAPDTVLPPALPADDGK